MASRKAREGRKGVGGAYCFVTLLRRSVRRVRCDLSGLCVRLSFPQENYPVGLGGKYVARNSPLGFPESMPAKGDKANPSFTLLRALRVLSTVIVLVLMAGCSARRQEKPWNEPAAWKPGTPVPKEFLYPDDNESRLTAAQKEKLEQLRLAWRPVELATPYDGDPAFRALYLDWFGRGYTFFAATGYDTISPHYNQPKDPAQRAKSAGWDAGELAARMKQIEGVLDELVVRSIAGQSSNQPLPSIETNKNR
jgi:hypothetical protein